MNPNYYDPRFGPPPPGSNNDPRFYPPPPPPGFGWYCIILSLIALLSITLVLIMNSATVKSRVVSASLTRFDLTTNNDTLLLDYNLTMDIDVKNPSIAVDINYKEVEVKAFYGGNRFGSVNIMPFYQGHHHKENKTTTLHPMFQGQASLEIPRWNKKYSELIDGFNRNESYGRFDIQLELHMKVGYKFGWIIKQHREPMFKCDLKRVPLITSSSSSNDDDHVGRDFPIKTKCKLAGRSNSRRPDRVK